MEKKIDGVIVWTTVGSVVGASEGNAVDGGSVGI